MDSTQIALVFITLGAAIVNGALGYGFSSITVPIALLFLTNRVLNPALVPIEVALNLPIDLRMDFVRLDEALSALRELSPEKARVVDLRYFGGLSIEETADAMELSPATVKRHWVFARAWLYRALGGA